MASILATLAADAAAQVTIQPKVEKVVVHPLVLLSVVDHFNRMKKTGNYKRVVGILLGSNKKGELDVSNSFAVPFDEDDKDRSVWYLDHDYLESMHTMFKKVNAREKIVGWYHTGPKLCPNDIKINELIRKYCPNSVLVIIDAKPKNLGLPTEAYVMVEEVHSDGTPSAKTFDHVPSDIGAEEAEEVGVEHLLRDIKESRVGTLSQRITTQLTSLKALHRQLQDIAAYLTQVTDGVLPINHQIIYQLQDIFNLLPDLTNSNFVQSMNVQTNDELLTVYLSTLIRSIMALHNLISNKLANREAERGQGDDKKKKKPVESKDSEKKTEDSDKKDSKDTKAKK